MTKSWKTHNNNGRRVCGTCDDRGVCFILTLLRGVVQLDMQLLYGGTREGGIGGGVTIAFRVEPCWNEILSSQSPEKIEIIELRKAWDFFSRRMK